MKAYKLLDKNEYYHKDNIKDFDMNKLKDAVGVYISSLGAMGCGGLVYVITSSGEEILFDYFSYHKEENTVYLKASPVWEILKEHLPMVCNELNGEPKGWQLVSSQAGWFLYVRKDYVRKFHKACKEYVKTSETYKDILQRKWQLQEVLNEFVIPHNGPEILLHIIKSKSLVKKIVITKRSNKY